MPLVEGDNSFRLTAIGQSGADLDYLIVGRVIPSEWTKINQQENGVAWGARDEIGWSLTMV